MSLRRLRDVATTVGRLAIDVAPIVAMLGRGSSPVAWVAAAAFVGHKIHNEIMTSRERAWSDLPWGITYAIMRLATSAQIGSIAARYDGGEERTYKGVLYGSGPGWHVGPYGDPRPLVDAIWETYGSLLLYKDGTRDTDRNLVKDKRSACEPSRLVVELADEQVLLHRSGAGVGLLIDGPPGSGKSQALLHVAAALGGRTLRASLKSISPEDVLGTAVALGATAVVMDDIDRSPTDGALDVVEQLIQRGVAVLASSNEKAEICEALLRDGRIDDHRSFGAIGPDVLERFTVGLELDVVERLRPCTVATVARYVERRKALGAERALEFLPVAAEP